MNSLSLYVGLVTMWAVLYMWTYVS